MEEYAIEDVATGPVLVRVQFRTAGVGVVVTAPPLQASDSTAESPDVALAERAVPALVEMLPRLFGTVLCTVACARRPRIHESPEVTSGWYWLVVVLVKVWARPPTAVPVVCARIVVGSPSLLKVFVVVTVGRTAPFRSQPSSLVWYR
jgi:hypothetical protein